MQLYPDARRFRSRCWWPSSFPNKLEFSVSCVENVPKWLANTVVKCHGSLKRKKKNWAYLEYNSVGPLSSPQKVHSSHPDLVCRIDREFHSRPLTIYPVRAVIFPLKLSTVRKPKN